MSQNPQLPQNPPQPELVDRIRVYRDDAGEWRWTAIAGNNEPVADSAEGYDHHADARDNAIEMFPGATVDDEGKEQS